MNANRVPGSGWRIALACRVRAFRFWWRSRHRLERLHDDSFEAREQRERWQERGIKVVPYVGIDPDGIHAIRVAFGSLRLCPCAECAGTGGPVPEHTKSMLQHSQHSKFIGGW